MNDKMNDKQAAETVLRWVLRSYADAVGRNTRADAEYQGNHAAKEAWDAQYDDGVGFGMGMNSMARDAEYLSRECKSTLKDQRDWECVKDFVIRRICNLVEETQ